MIGFTISAFLILLSNPTNKRLFLGGALLGIGALFKTPSAFDAPAIVFFWLITTRLTRQNLVLIIKKTLIVAAGFAFPILATFVWYYAKGALSEYWAAAFLQNVGYISAWRGGAMMSQPFVLKNAPLIMRAWVVAIGLIFLKVYQKRLSPAFTFAVIWLLCSLFGATLSERPYPHYLIQIIPSISLLIAFLAASKTVEQVLTIIPLFLALLASVYYKFYYYPTFSYYTRFLSFITGETTKWQYFDQFGRSVTPNYKISQILKDSTAPDDKIFAWGDSAPIIYALSRRLPPIKYVATYHINDFSNQSEVIKSLTKNPPAFIVIEENSTHFPLLRAFAQQNYYLIQNETKSEIWRLMSPQVKSKL